ncbi:M56 family metallopeptidase [Streptomyces sp. MZ04]|uniref:M56 family metallopeptidase n=1 Tax=Streptomyces sp. MZ04 TaxID=2559236 RepID=UPI00107ECF37|nr:M56 family metallopeptidase [Streptomyces sp. MZ04]TGB15142.1 M56 family peptidase [Streptomyces sp. MZ04]
MIIAVGLLLAAALCSWLAPRLLLALDPRRFDPTLLLACWFSAVAGVLITIGLGLAALLLPGHLLLVAHGAGHGLLPASMHWPRSVPHGSPPAWEKAAGDWGCVLLCIVALRLVYVAARSGRRRIRTRRDCLATLRGTAREEPGQPLTLWVPHGRPFAFSMAGRPGVVVVTDGMTHHLHPLHLAAVLAHERAHLRGRHHALVACAEALKAALPVVPLFRIAPSAVRELVEVAADKRAAAQYGPAAVASALQQASGAPTQEADGLMMVGPGSIELRLIRLADAMPRPGRFRRSVSCLAGVLVAGLFPVASATVLVAVTIHVLLLCH